MTDRRKFLKDLAMISAAAATAPALMSMNGLSDEQKAQIATESDSFWSVPRNSALKITGTFLDEISHDIPHQNWGVKEWEQDFKNMKAIGIDTVIMIRSGYRKFITYPSPYLIKKGCYRPSQDLLEMFLTLADRYGMKFYFGLYDSGRYWDTGDLSWEIEDNKYVIDEVWKNYGSKHKSFQGWYLCQEVSRRTRNISKIFADMGRHAKEVSGGLPCMISPYIHGIKTDQVMGGDTATTYEEHEREWDDILSNLQGVVDIMAFQDGQVDYWELYGYLCINKKLADKYGIHCWTNLESFDRDMPINFLPIKFDKLRMKLEAAKRCGYDKAITFEFPHFMSPQSVYGAAGNLYERYKEYFNIL